MQTLTRPLLPAALLLATLGTAAPQEPTSQFGEPLIVNGERISDMEIKRFLIYGPGRNAMEARKLELLMQQEKELRVYEARERLADEQHQAVFDDLTEEQAAAIDATVAAELSYMEVDVEEAKERVRLQGEDFKLRYPTLDPDTETERAYRSVAWYEDQVYQTMRFDEMFFPGHPDGWPEITVEAVHAGSPQYDLVADYAMHWDMRKKAAEEAGEEMKREDDMMMSLLRDYVMNALYSLVETRTGVDGLEPELLLTIEGLGFYAEIRTDDVFEEFKDVFTWRDVAEAKRFLALQAAATQKLEQLGHLRDRDEFLGEITEMREQLATSMFNVQFIALMGHQFPSEEAYTEHLYGLESFKKLIEGDITRDESNQISPALEEYMEFANVVMGLGRCLTEVCFVSAFDFPNNEWREDGFDGAYDRAMALRGEIDGYIDRLIQAETDKQTAVAAGENFDWPEDLLTFDRYWSNFLDLNSEFWDPPLPITGKAPPELGRKNKGRFQDEAMTRNDYKRALGESSYYFYLFNTSACDEVFMEQEPGSVAGPFIAPWGYYIVHLRSRLAPTSPLDMLEERHFQMVVEDYSRNKYTEFAHQALEEADVSGLPDGLGGN